MKKLVMILMICLSANVFVSAQDVYICTTVLFCNEEGTRCVEIEICDVVESVISELKNPFRGLFKEKSSVLVLGDFPKSFENRTINIKKGTKLIAPGKMDGEKGLIGREVEPGEYTIQNGHFKLKIDK